MIQAITLPRLQALLHMHPDFQHPTLAFFSISVPLTILGGNFEDYSSLIPTSEPSRLGVVQWLHYP